MIRQSSFIWIAIAIFFCLAALGMQRRPATIYKESATASNMYYLPTHAWLNVFSSGYNEATADLVWIKFIIYFSTAPKKEVKQGQFITKEFLEKQKKQPRLKNYTLNYITAATKLDPYFEAAYIHGSRLAMYHQGVLSKETIETSMKILEKGLSYFPDNGEMLFNLGFLYYYEIIPFIEDEDEIDKLQRKGTRYIHKSSSSPDAPSYAAALSDQLLDRHGMNDLMVEHLKHQVLIETDPDIRKIRLESLKHALGEQRQSDLVQLEQLHREWMADYPFVPIELFSILVPEKDNIHSLLTD